MTMGVRISPLVELGAVARPPPGDAVDTGERVKAVGVLGNGVSQSLGVEKEGVLGQVVDGITGTMVVDVVGHASLAIEELCLLLGHNALGTGKESARGDAVLNESGIVGTARELGGHRRNTLAGEEVLKVLLDDIGAGGALKTESIAVAVINAVDEVGARNLIMCVSDERFELEAWWGNITASYHVRVEVATDLGNLGLGAVDGLDVGVRAEQAELLSRPEAESDSVLDLELAEGNSNIQHADSAGAVIVDARPVRDRVGVSTKNHHVVVIALLGLSNDVEGDPVLDHGLHLQVSLHLTSLQSSKNGLSCLLGDADNGNIAVRSLSEGAADGALSVVVNHRRTSARSLGRGRLGAKGALATGDERDLAGDLSWVVLGVAAQIGHLDKVGVDIAGRGVGHDVCVDVGSIHAQGSRARRKELNKGLLSHGVVVECAERVEQVVDGAVVAGRAEGAVAAIAVSDGLELAGSGHEAVDGDLRLELLGSDELLDRVRRLDAGLLRAVRLRGAGEGGQQQSRAGERAGGGPHRELATAV